MKEIRKYLLFTLGPVNVTENVRQSISKVDISHREEDFSNLLQSVEQKLLGLFEIKNTNKYRAVIITGSGTAANEAVLSSIPNNKNILVLSNGEFGERLYNISKIHNQNTHLLKFRWGERLNLEKIITYLKKRTVDIIAMVHHETSTGILNSLAEVSALSRAIGAKLIVDGVSSVGAETIDMEKCHIAFCTSSSSKAIGSYPGLSFVVGRKSEFNKLKRTPAKTSYLNLFKFYRYLDTVLQTPNTPAVPLFYALEQALINILSEGVKNHHDQIRHKACLLRNGMSRLGLEFLINPEDMCSVLTTVLIPPHISIDAFFQRLRDRFIIIYKGKGYLKERAFQVGNIGEISFDDIHYFLDSLDEVLQSFERIGNNQILSIDNNPMLGTINEITADQFLKVESIAK